MCRVCKIFEAFLWSPNLSVPQNELPLPQQEVVLVLVVVRLALYLAMTICHILNTTTAAAMIATTRTAMQSIALKQSNKRQGNNASQHKFYLFYKRTLREHLTRCPDTHTHTLTHRQTKRYLNPLDSLDSTRRQIVSLMAGNIVV